MSATSRVLPRYGSYRGKGEALWKSLYETTGDLVAWSDTDIRDWHPRFLYGTLGPLLDGAAHRLRQGLLPAADRPGRPDEGGRRRTRHGARRAAAHQPLLPGAVGLHPAARGRVRRTARAPRGASRSSPATRSRSATSSTSRSGSGSTASARSTWTSGPSQPGAGGPLEDELRHPPGGHEAARGARRGRRSCRGARARP